MTEHKILPLEYLLQKICPNQANFPNTDNYFDKYWEILGQLRREVYKDVNAGLAALSEESGLYTDHSGDHFDEVILHAGIILGLYRDADVDKIIDDVVSHKWLLTPYEIYILLLSIRLHDVGNIYGRENHEQNINKVIQKFSLSYLHKDRIEANMVAAIAGAHGGKTQDGDKDTIGRLQHSESNGHICDINGKKIAAITRIADEICENRKRVFSSDSLEIPIHNLVFHKYAKAIYVNSIQNRTLILKLQFHIGDLLKEYNIYENNEGNKSLISVNLPQIALDRLKKAELERRYCNRFIPDKAQIKGLSVHIEILEDTMDEESFKHESLDQITFTLQEEGYPLKEELIFDTKIVDFLNYERICQTCQDKEA